MKKLRCFLAPLFLLLSAPTFASDVTLFGGVQHQGKLTNESAAQSATNFGTKFAINYGGGLKILPAGPVGIHFDTRDYAIPSVKVSSPTSIKSQTLNMIEASAGVIFSN